MAEFDPNSLTKASLPEAIKTCKKYETKYKDKEIKKKKYEDMRNVFEKAQTTLDKAINATKNIQMASGKSFYEEFVKGNEMSVSLCWLGTKLNEERINGNVASGDDPNFGSFSNVEFHYDFIDGTKQVWHDFTHGKGLSKGLATVAGGVLVGELLTKGITSLLVKKGILEGSMGLLGLGQLGIQYAPMAWQALTSAAGAVAAWSSVLPIAAGAFVAVKAIPVIKNLVDKVKAKFKEAGAFDENMEKLVAGQKTLS